MNIQRSVSTSQKIYHNQSVTAFSEELDISNSYIYEKYIPEKKIVDCRACAANNELVRNRGMKINIYNLLYCLGITQKYRGFFYTSYAVELVYENKERLLLVTKCLYPDIAKHYNSNGSAVERNIRTVVKRAWNYNPKGLIQIARYDLTNIPTASQFVAILAANIEIPD